MSLCELKDKLSKFQHQEPTVRIHHNMPFWKRKLESKILEDKNVVYNKIYYYFTLTTGKRLRKPDYNFSLLFLSTAFMFCKRYSSIKLYISIANFFLQYQSNSIILKNTKHLYFYPQILATGLHTY